MTEFLEKTILLSHIACQRHGQHQHRFQNRLQDTLVRSSVKRAQRGTGQRESCTSHSGQLRDTSFGKDITILWRHFQTVVTFVHWPHDSFERSEFMLPGNTNYTKHQIRNFSVRKTSLLPRKAQCAYEYCVKILWRSSK